MNTKFKSWFRSQNGWNALVCSIYLLIVAMGYLWVYMGEDSFERLARVFLVWEESMAGCFFLLAIMMSPPKWFRD